MKTKPLPSLDALIYGMIKFRRLQERREKMSALRLATDQQAKLSEEPQRRATHKDFEDGEIEAGRSLFRGFLEEFTSNPTYRVFIERQLLDEEPLFVLSQELGIRHSTARSLIHRFRKFLGH